MFDLNIMLWYNVKARVCNHTLMGGLIKRLV